MTKICSTDSLTFLVSSLLHVLLLLCSFLVHHPLVSVYSFLLSPYLLNLLRLLYPLIFSTSLLLLAFLTVSPHFYDSPSTRSEFPGSVCSAVLNILCVEFIPDEAVASLIEQLCSMVLDMEDHFNQMGPNEVHLFSNSGSPAEMLVIDCQNCEFSVVKAKEDGAENLCENSEDNVCSGHRPREEEEERVTKTMLPCRKEDNRSPSEILRRDGSARKEKEWKRTLACKLFEERMTYKLFEDRKVVEEVGDMDLLWEAYEVGAHKADKPTRKQRREKRPVKEEEESNGHDEEVMSGHPCCLKALRFSAGKMNPRVGRPSLVKISMALKGMALFHSAERRARRE